MDTRPLVKYYLKFVEIFDEAKVEAFKRLDTDSARVHYVYNALCGEPISLIQTNKSYDEAVNYKLAGNKQYAKKLFKEAIDLYLKGALICPQDDPRGAELYSHLAANLSAAYFEIGEYEKSYEEIEHIKKDLGAYPRHLLYKLHVRQAKCVRLMRRPLAEILECYEEARNLLAVSNLPANERKVCEDAINDGIEDAERNVIAAAVSEHVETRANDYLGTFESNRKYPSLSHKITVDRDDTQGRYVKAVAAIKPGELLAWERPYTSCITKRCSKTHCHHCKRRCVVIIPCRNCCTVVFCSTSCTNSSVAYHTFECKILETMYGLEVSLNNHLALRAITRNSLSYLLSGDYLDRERQNAEDTQESADYVPIYELCNHAAEMDAQSYMDLSFAAVLILRLLKQTDYFGGATEGGTLTDDECYIGSLLIRHLLSFQFNAHEVAEIVYLGDAVGGGGGGPLGESFTSTGIGGAVYGTSSLFNHSCAPSVARYNLGDILVLRAIKPIGEGDIVFDNYGPMYSSMNLNDRQTTLKDKYLFECKCIACTDNYPLFEEMDAENMKLYCTFCKSGIPLTKSTKSPNVTCTRCGKENVILSQLLSMSHAEVLCKKADGFFAEKNYEEALITYGQAVTVLLKHLEPPHPDILQLQQKMRNSMVHIQSLVH